jgi:ribosomal protein S18 acetylase RimI-like enzyme
MPTLHDRAAIRAILATDRPWSLYALGDLAPGLFEHCSWFQTETAPPALALLFRGFDVPILFTLGSPGGIATLLSEFGAEPALYLHVRPEIVPVIETCYRIPEKKRMWRMLLDASKYHPASVEGAVRLGPADLASVKRLYSDGEATGESPAFFFESMLEQGVFFGLRDGSELVAIAGTHLVTPAEGVAAIGNVYTRRDHRRRGLGALVTSAAASELLGQGIPVVALNVSQHNHAAIRIYERLGFATYCEFIEGVATRADEDVGRGPGGPPHI